MRIPSLLHPALAGLLLCAPAAALSAQTRTIAHHSADASIGVRFGTLGVGGEVAKLVTSHLGLRVGANFLNYSTSRTESDISFDAKLKMKGMSALVDLFPGSRGSFHLTGGIMTNPVEITATGVPSGTGTYEINGTTYTAAQVGTLTGSGKWPKTSPYAGFGFGTPAASKGGLKFVFDLGAVISKPTITLSASNQDPTLQANVAAQQAKTQKDVEKYAKVYPVLSFGLVYRF
jgi:hypothetical protein